MTHLCKMCLREVRVKRYIASLNELSEFLQLDEIHFKQWISTDWCTLIKWNQLMNMFPHWARRSQTLQGITIFPNNRHFLTELKYSLPDNEAVVFGLLKIIPSLLKMQHRASTRKILSVHCIYLFCNICFPNITKLHPYFTMSLLTSTRIGLTFQILCNHYNDFGIKCEWHLFATSHGKNACDGIGGTHHKSYS